MAVIDQRTPTREVFANPGGTLTAHLTPVPVRFRRGAGADLVMHADRDGFRQHLVIKNTNAVRNPALASIRLVLRAEGLRVSVDDSGAMHAVDEAGAEVFGAPPPRPRSEVRLGSALEIR